jgi:hypothetical protein
MPGAERTHAPAGWYKNPNNSNQQRYWDGFHWTDEVKPPTLSATPPIYMSYDDAAEGSSTSRKPTNYAWLEFLTFVLRIMFFLTFIGTLVAASLLLRQANGQTDGRTLDLIATGVAIGGMFISLILVALADFITLMRNSARHLENIAKHMGRLKYEKQR